MKVNPLMLALGAITSFAMGAAVYSTSTTDTYTAQLISAVSQAGTDVVFNKCSDAEGELYGRYQYETDDEGFFIKDVLTVCTSWTDMTDSDLVWETLAHEATHVAQACDGVGVSGMTAKELRRGVSGRYDIDKLMEIYEPEDHEYEFEAFYMETAPKEDVIQMVTEACADNFNN